MKPICRIISFLLTFIALSCCLSCATSAKNRAEQWYATDALPPVITLSARAQDSSKTASSTGNMPGHLGQAVVVGNMALTAAHVLPEFRSPLWNRSYSLFISENMVPHKVVAAGVSGNDKITTLIAVPGDAFDEDAPFSLDHIEGFMVSDTEDYDTVSQRIYRDWALVQLDSAPAIGGCAIEIDTDPISPGLGVSLIRSIHNGRIVAKLDTHVITTPASISNPESVVFLAKPTHFDASGWSGGFVGRKTTSGRWQLIGVLSATVINDNGREISLIAVRPPREVLEQLVSGGADAME